MTSEIGTNDSMDLRARFVNLVFRELQLDYLDTPIQWKESGEGKTLDAETICREYYKPELEIVRQRFMKDRAGRIDRHKIIALTQRIIIAIQPLDFVDPSSFSDDERYGLNVEFAFLFGIHFISRWNEMYYPEKRFENKDNPFDTEKFLTPLNETQEGNDFYREHYKLLSMKTWTAPFPLFATAQLWFALEQWGLSYARSQKGWPAEKSPTLPN